MLPSVRIHLDFFHIVMINISMQMFWSLRKLFWTRRKILVSQNVTLYLAKVSSFTECYCHKCMYQFCFNFFPPCLFLFLYNHQLSLKSYFKRAIIEFNLSIFFLIVLKNPLLPFLCLYLPTYCNFFCTSRYPCISLV